MTSLTDILALLSVWPEFDAPDSRAALATVVYVKGSAYRRPGARMLVTATGRSAGMISGGCLEDDVRSHAHRVIESGESRVITYDTTSPADVIFGLGLGCNGVVKILIEPVCAGQGNDLLTFLAVCHDRRQAGRIATIFAAESVAPGSRLLCWPDGSVTANFADRAMRETLLGALDDCEGRRAAIRKVTHQGGEIRILLETIAPPTSLLLFGAGDDAIPLAQFAKQLGWQVTVIDPRPEYARRERFATADAVLCLHPNQVASHPQVKFSPQTVAMIMTHNFSRDKELLLTVLPRCPRYVGILGPRVRTQRIIDELTAEGAALVPEMLARLHGPAGLDIGAETPEEIALSIIAEIRAVLGHRPGSSLRLRTGAIHEAAEGTP